MRKGLVIFGTLVVAGVAGIIAYRKHKKSEEEDLAKTMIESGIRGFWNFSHYDFAINFDNIIVENVHISDSLLTLCFQMSKLN